jgi:hypothetical protein
VTREGSSLFVTAVRSAARSEVETKRNRRCFIEED